MRSLEDINKEYTQVATHLGDMAFKKLDLEDTLHTIKDQITSLDKSMGELRLTRNALVKAAAELNVKAQATPPPAIGVDPEGQNAIVDALVGPT